MCWVEGKVIGELRNDYLLVRIEPPAIDFKSKELLERILISGRNMPINPKKFPTNIYILKIIDTSVITNHRCDALSVEVIATADIFSSFKAAEELSTRAEA